MARLARLVVAAAAACVAAVWLTTGVAHAQGTTHTISFTGSGPSPASVRIGDGDRVQFRNDIDPSASVPVLGPATGALSSVAVTVSGATSGAFTLARGKSVTVGPYHSGARALVAHYTSTYSSRLVLGALPGPSKRTGGTVTVAAHAAPPAPNSPAHGNGAQPGAGQSAGRAQTSTAPPSDAAPPTPTGDSASAVSTGPTLHYTPQAPNVAAEVVPHGNGGTFRSSAPHGRPASQADRSQAEPSSAGAGLPPESDDGPVHPAAASSDVPELPFGLDWTAVIAGLLLCAVLGVLVRTLIVRRLLPGGSRTPDS